jgi:hypothetical protein
MSRLLGPLSETISNVSWRDCARAGKIAGMGSTPPAASAVIERRNSRRFIATSPYLSKRVLVEARSRETSLQSRPAQPPFEAFLLIVSANAVPRRSRCAADR